MMQLTHWFTVARDTNWTNMCPVLNAELDHPDRAHVRRILHSNFDQRYAEERATQEIVLVTCPWCYQKILRALAIGAMGLEHFKDATIAVIAEIENNIPQPQQALDYTK